MENIYKITDLVLMRAGATSLSEIAYYGVPAVLVPYPFAKDNHQFYNARYFLEKGAAVLGFQDDREGLLDTVLDLLKSGKDLLKMSAKAEKIFGRNVNEKIIRMLKKEVIDVR